MRILQVMAGAEKGGAETAFVDMCIALHEAGENIVVATRPNDLRVPQLREAGIEVHTLPFGGAIDVFTPWKLRKIITDFKPDTVQGWMQRGPSKIPAWKESMGIPRYIVSARLGGYYKLKHYKTTDYFVAITPDLKRHLIDNGVARECTREIYNFAETEAIKAPVHREDYGVPKDAPLLLALGRLHEAKAFDMLIPVVAQMPGVCLWIAGEGPDRAALEGLIEDLGCGDRIKLLGWRSDRAALLEAADICVFPSRYEPFGTVFVQAWAQKTPLITTASDGPRQFVRDGDDGLVVPVDDADALSLGIRRLIDDPALCETLVERGYARYQQSFTKEKCVQAYLQFYHDMREREGL